MNSTAGTVRIGDDQRKALSRTFIIFAWVIEASAASVGLILAINRLQDDVGAQGLLAALPFFAVAIMEMTKIPLATVIYHTASKKWRYGFAVALALSMVITFETFAIGFDTYQTQIEKKIKPTVDKIKALKYEIASIEKNKVTSQALVQKGNTLDIVYRAKNETIRAKFEPIIAEYQAQKIDIEKRYEGSKNALRSQISNLEKQIATKNTLIREERNLLTEAIKDQSEKEKIRGQEISAGVRENINALRSSIKQIRDNKVRVEEQIRQQATKDYEECDYSCDSRILKPRDKKINELEKSTKQEIKGLQGDIRSQQELLSSINSKISPKEEANLRQRYETRVETINAEINNLRKQQVEKQTRIEKLGAKRSLTDQEQLRNIGQKIKEVVELRDDELKIASTEYEKQKGLSSAAEEAIAEFVKMENDRRQDLSDPCSELNEKVASNQVYRLALQFHNVDDACDLTQEQITLTQWLWFGSLALVVSALGTTLAFAGLVIKYPPSPPKGEGLLRNTNGLIRRLSYAIVLIQRRLRKPVIKKEVVETEIIKEVPKEVIKEVPVEKVVYRDVPREVIKRELVHVPLFTQNISDIVKDE